MIDKIKKSGWRGPTFPFENPVSNSESNVQTSSEQWFNFQSSGWSDSEQSELLLVGINEKYGFVPRQFVRISQNFYNKSTWTVTYTVDNFTESPLKNF